MHIHVYNLPTTLCYIYLQYCWVLEQLGTIVCIYFVHLLVYHASYYWTIIKFGTITARLIFKTLPVISKLPSPQLTNIDVMKNLSPHPQFYIQLNPSHCRSIIDGACGRCLHLYQLMLLLRNMTVA